ncbi:MAG: hypothetical protein IPJ36_14900 [Simplicispira sp.]|nr:hypothetical protein [Simplicispira sp.]
MSARCTVIGASRTWLAKLGDWMARNRGRIAQLQWGSEQRTVVAHDALPAGVRCVQLARWRGHRGLAHWRRRAGGRFCSPCHGHGGVGGASRLEGAGPLRRTAAACGGPVWGSAMATALVAAAAALPVLLWVRTLDLLTVV